MAALLWLGLATLVVTACALPESLIEDIEQSRTAAKSNNHKVKRAEDFFSASQTSRFRPMMEYQTWPQKTGFHDDNSVEEYLSSSRSPWLRPAEEDDFQTNHLGRPGRLAVMPRHHLPLYPGYSDYLFMDPMRKKREAKGPSVTQVRKKRQSGVSPEELLRFMRLWEADAGRSYRHSRLPEVETDDPESLGYFSEDMMEEQPADGQVPDDWEDVNEVEYPLSFWSRPRKFSPTKKTVEEFNPRVVQRLVL